MKKKCLVAIGLGALAAVLYLASLAHYAYPGESARLMALWLGLDASGKVEYPLMAFFARLLGGGNLLAPICGAISVFAIYSLVAAFVARWMTKRTALGADAEDGYTSRGKERVLALQRRKQEVISATLETTDAQVMETLTAADLNELLS